MESLLFPGAIARGGVIDPAPAMPRIPRGQQAGFVYHVINRGNGRATIFHKAQDYQAFLSILALAKARHPVKMFGFSLMPNHFHFVIEASHHQSLSRFMQWLLTSHVRRYHKHYGSSGHVWQGRFKSFPVQRDEHLLMVLRYVLQNPVRSGLAASGSRARGSTRSSRATVRARCSSTSRPTATPRR